MEVFEEKSTIEQWDEDYYHPIALKLYDRAILDMLQMMAVEPGATVLDAGCGPGVHSIRVAKAGHYVCAIDISEAMLGQAQQRAKSANVADRIEFYQQDLTELDLADSSFRYVFSWGVIIHIPRAEKALDELARIVEPGGKLALYITNKAAVDHQIESFMRLVARKPLAGLQHLLLGDGIWYEMNDQKLWVWRFETKAITEYLATKGFNLKYCHIGELSEIQRRLRGIPRNLLLHLNNLSYRLNWLTDLATTQLLIFEKKRL
jgi:2-polyprenyl-3-methyl-5-hydroxy-6-metoxy-1,4-benzoquinol methylase